MPVSHSLASVQGKPASELELGGTELAPPLDVDVSPPRPNPLEPPSVEPIDASPP